MEEENLDSACPEMEGEERSNDVSEENTNSSSGSVGGRLQMEARFECPICLSCLKSPYITSCGHKFCKECIHQWLRKEGGTCPIDSERLTLEDIFPDNYTKREISQVVVTCPVPHCSKALPLLEADRHAFQQHHHEEASNEDRKGCPFYRVGCQFECASQTRLQAHLQAYISHHLLLVCQGLEKLDSDMRLLGQAGEASLWDPPSKSSNLSPTSLLKTLYEKMVLLEQMVQERSIDVKMIKSEVQEVKGWVDGQAGRRSEGVLLWRLERAAHALEGMARDPSVRLFSQPFYTSYYGYKFCCRLNTSPSDPSYLSLNVHLMKGEHDYSLVWPFCGRIQVCLVHPSSCERSLRETMVSNPALDAFKRPRNDVALRGFGYADFVRLPDLLESGFIGPDDTLHIRVHITCV